MRLPIYRNHYANHVEYVVLLEKGLTKRVVGAVVAVIALMTLYFTI